MQYLITELVKYLDIILVTLYTYFAYRVFIIKDKGKQKRIYRQMSVLMYLFHGSAYLVILIRGGNADIIVLYAAQVLSFIILSILYQKCYKNLSLLIFQNMRMLLCFGYIMLARLSLQLVLKHFLFSMTMLLLCLIVPEMIKKFKLWGSLGYIYLTLGLFLLVVVLFFGSEVYGAVNWIVIGNFKFQPSEIVKLLFVFGSAALLSKRQDFKRICIVTLLAAAHVLVLVLEKDLGGAMLYFVTYVIILYCATQKWIYLVTGLAAGIFASLASYYLFYHVQVRVAAFINPFALIEKQGYQLSQSLFAIGTGGFYGLGLMNGIPESIPVAESDFIFSAISEEMGGFAAICLSLICLSCFILFVNLSVKIKDTFYKLVALGLSTMYIFQVFVNIAGVIKLIPSTGITLPFVSSGGSSVISSILTFSILQGIFVLNFEPQKIKTVTTQKQKDILEEYNRSIVWITYVFAFFIFTAIGYVTYFNIFKAKSVINNTYNLRTDVIASQVVRGKIYSSDGKILAQSILLEEGEAFRVYPYERVFSHVVGRLNKGKTGLELSENFNLLNSGISGFERVSLQMKDEKLPGDNIVTTFDTVLQQTAYDALSGYKGAVVVLEASTGKILAMVSKPDYNPNTIAADWDKIVKEGTGDSALINRAAQGLYPPGSTFKILTALLYIRENPGYQDFVYECNGSERNFNVTIHCAGNKAHGTVDLKQAFAVSCNSAFAYLGSTLDMDKFGKLCSDFLFGRSLPGKLSASVSQFKMSSNTDTSEIPQTVIGLGKILITPLHNAMIAAAIANDGILMEPYMISRIENANGKIIKKYSPKAYGRLMTEEEAKVLSEYMGYVVEKGTASALSKLSVPVAGKTGTAEFETGKEPHAWFVGFTKDIVISVVVENVGSGSSYAVPIAGKVIEAYYSVK